MNQIIALLFGIPVLCIVVIAVKQFIRETYNEKFVIGRRSNRTGSSAGPRVSRSSQGAQAHRDTDPVAQLEATTKSAEALADSLADVASPILQPSIVRR